MSFRIIDFDRLIGIFSFFVFGTLSIIIYLLTLTSLNPWLNSLRDSLFLIFFISYEIVVISIISHYIEKKKQDFIREIKKNSIRYSLLLILIGLIAYGAVIYLKTKNVLEAIEKILYISLLLIGGLSSQFIVKWLIDKFKPEPQKKQI